MIDFDLECIEMAAELVLNENGNLNTVFLLDDYFKKLTKFRTTFRRGN